MNNHVGATGDTLEKILRPTLKDMIFSVARHRICFETTFTYQFPLWTLQADQAGSQEDLQDWLDVCAADTLEATIHDRLDVSLSDSSVVWCMGDLGQLSIVNDYKSLCVATMNHQHTGKGIIQLYVVKNTGQNIPETYDCGLIS
ncbi:hypothetical protein KCU77_g4057, partial [Aureobasidium melanogenum]